MGLLNESMPHFFYPSVFPPSAHAKFNAFPPLELEPFYLERMTTTTKTPTSDIFSRQLTRLNLNHAANTKTSGLAEGVLLEPLGDEPPLLPEKSLGSRQTARGRRSRGEKTVEGGRLALVARSRGRRSGRGSAGRGGQGAEAIKRGVL